MLMCLEIVQRKTDSFVYNIYADVAFEMEKQIV